MENKEELDARVKKFMDEYKALVELHKIDIANVPTYVPDESGGFKTVVQSYTVDVSNRPTESPFVAKS